MLFLKLIVAACTVVQILSVTSSPSKSPTKSPTRSPTVTGAPTTPRAAYFSIYAFAGQAGVSGTASDGSTASSSSVGQPYGLWQDSAGSIYYSEYNYHCVRKVDTSNIVTAVAGCTSGTFSGDSGPATASSLYFPKGIFVTTQGKLYIADYYNYRVRTVSTSGIITTFAGNGGSGNTQSGYKATGTNLYNPYAVWGNSVGVMYIANYYQVNSVNTAAIISTFAGRSSDVEYGPYGYDGPATSASLFTPVAVVGDTTGRMYITQSDRNVVTSVSSGVLSRVTGYSSSGSYDGEYIQATSSSLNGPYGLAVDSANGDLYIANQKNYRVQVITAAYGWVTTFAGTGTSSSTGDGGYATSATFKYPTALYRSSVSEIYVSDWSACTIRRIASTTAPAIPSVMPTISLSPSTIAPSATPSVSSAPTGARGSWYSIYKFAGGGSIYSTINGGKATSSGLYSPYAVWQDSSSGDVYITQYYGSCISKIDSAGIIHDMAGTCSYSFSTSNPSKGNGGPATSASLNNPYGLCFNTVGTLYFSEFSKGKVRTVSTDGIVSAFAGSGNSTQDSTQATSAYLVNPSSLWANTMGSVFIAIQDSYGFVKQVSTSGIISVFAGFGATTGYGQNVAATSAQLSNKLGLSGDSTGRLFIGDADNDKVRVVAINGIISDVAGNEYGSYNGGSVAATAANVNYPIGLSIDAGNGDIYVAAKYDNRLLVVVASTSKVSTHAGNGNAGSASDGALATQSNLGYPVAVVANTMGEVYVNENYISTIRRVAPSPAPTPAPSVSSAPTITYYQRQISKYAGMGTAGSTGNGVQATSALVYTPYGIVQDTSGNTYFSQQYGGCVRKVDANGIISDYMGDCDYTTDNSSDGAPATSAYLNNVLGVFADTVGGVFCADNGQNKIKTVSTSGTIVTYAGTGASTFNSIETGVKASSAIVVIPIGVWGDSSGNLFVSSYHLIRRISSSQIITTYAGTTSSGSSGDGGPATAATMTYPGFMFWDTVGGLYFSSASTFKVRYVSSGSIVSLVAGTGSSGYSGENIRATSSKMNAPYGIALDSVSGDLFVSNKGAYRVQMLNATSGLFVTVAGNGTRGTYGTDGMTPTSVELCDPYGVFLNTNSDLYIAESGSYTGNNLIRVVKTVAVSVATPLTSSPTFTPTMAPTTPTVIPSFVPTTNPSLKPTVSPTIMPSDYPTIAPSLNPTANPTVAPTLRPTASPTVSTKSPSLKPSVRPSLAPSSLFPTNMPSAPGWVTLYQHNGAGCHYDNVVSIFAYKSNVCIPWINRFGKTYSKYSSSFGSKMFECKNGVVFRYSYDSPDCVDLRDTYSVWSRNNSLGGCTVSPYNPEDGVNDDFDPYYYSYQCYTNSEAAMSTVNITGNTATFREYVGSDGCLSSDMTSGSTQKLNYCYSDKYNDSYYSHGVYKSTEYKYSWLYTSNQSFSYDGTDDCDASRADEVDIRNYTSGCQSPFDINDDYYYTSDHTYQLFTVSFSDSTGAPSRQPSRAPTGPTKPPTHGPTAPTLVPSAASTVSPSKGPTCSPSIVPSLTPTLSPTCTPSVGPSIVPTLAPSSLKPSVAPTTVAPTLTFAPTSPTVSPSEAPTVVPSAAPSGVPSVFPSVVPTAVPSTNPSLIPTQVPSVSPSQVPTLAPSARPTAGPSVNPSMGPSIPPTIEPSKIPTVVPSVAPSLAVGESARPSIVPSFSPSLRPSERPSALPTLSPTPQTAPVLSFAASTTLNGLDTPDLDKAAQDSIVNATAASMGIDSQYVNYTGCTATPVRRRLDGGGWKVKGVKYNVEAHTDVVIPMTIFIATSGVNITDPTVLYTTLTAALTDAVSNGDFLTHLAAASAAFGSTTTANVSSSSVTVSAPQVQYPPSPFPSEAPHSTPSGGLSTGALIGIVVGVVGGFILIVVGVWCFLRSKGRRVNPVAVVPLPDNAELEMTRLEA